MGSLQLGFALASWSCAEMGRPEPPYVSGWTRSELESHFQVQGPRLGFPWFRQGVGKLWPKS